MQRQLLHYEIVREIGRGGMGVVYQARDPRLDRHVAIKVLPPESVADPTRKQRFVQEARAASALNHPNIVTVYEIDSDNGVDLMVMEHVEGAPLDRLIPAKGLPPSTALTYAIQIADALATAHEAGILHRDLKPSNIMATAQGRIKILDFGVAKLLDRSETSPEGPTLSARLETQDGVVLGTVSYMSPEQAEGRELDARSDIFSFGSVLYEMLTGRRPFAGDSHASIVAKILREDPTPVSQLAPSVPSDLAKVVSHCLRKDPARRSQHMGDVKVALEDVRDEWSSGAQQSQVPKRSRRRMAISIAAALVIACAAGFALWRGLRGPADPDFPKAVRLTTLVGLEKYPTLAPDGEHVAFTWSGEGQDNDDIYVLRIGSGAPLQRTSDPAADFGPAWSPDGRWIAFLRRTERGRSELRLLPPLGGPDQPVGEIETRQLFPSPPYLSWLPNSKWLVVAESTGSNSPDGLSLISIESGERRRLTKPAPPAADDKMPAVSPDGRSLAFVRDDGVHVLPLKDDFTPAGDARRLTDPALRAGHPVWSPDGKEILFIAQRRLWRVDAVGSQPAEQLAFVGDGASMPAMSRPREGRPARLVYVHGTVDPNVWRLEVPALGAPAASPPVLHISSTQVDVNPQFSDDGRQIAFQSDRNGTMEIWVAPADGSNPRHLTSTSHGSRYDGTPRWSPNGKTIAFDSNREGPADIYVVPSAGGEPRRLTDHPARDVVPSFSRDGRRIYFCSMRTGAPQIWKMSESGGDQEQVTRNEGFVAFESADGNLYYSQTASGPSGLWRMPVAGGDAVKVADGIAERAFAVVDRGVYYIEEQREQKSYEVFAPDGGLVPRVRGVLRFWDSSTRRSTVVADLGGSIALGLAATRDGRRVLFSRSDAPASDLMLVDYFPR